MAFTSATAWVEGLLPSIDLLHQFTVADAMAETLSVAHSEEIVQAPSTATLLELAQLMTDRGVNSVEIVEEHYRSPDIHGSEGLDGSSLEAIAQQHGPMGLFTERDVVQAVAQGLDLAAVQVHTLLTPAIVSVELETSLWTANQLMQTHQAKLVRVTTGAGEQVGILTEADLLRMLHPPALNRLTEQLVQRRTQNLEDQLLRSQLLTHIALHIRDSLSMQEVLDVTVTGVRSLLRCDRTLVYQLQPDHSGVVVAESVGEGWTRALGNRIEDGGFQEKIPLYQQGRVIAVNNVYAAGYADCHLELLVQYQVKAHLIVPIIVSGQLWGLLVGHQCRDDRSWQETDLTWLNEMGVQLAIAIQQATIHQQLQAELQARQQSQQELQQQRDLLRLIIDTIPNLIFLKDWEGRYLLANRAIAEFYQTTPECLIGHYDRDFHPNPTMTDRYVRENRAVIENQRSLFIPEEKSLSVAGRERWFQWQKRPITLPGTAIQAALGVGVEITPHKQAQIALKQTEAALQESEQFLRSIYEGVEQAIFTVDVLEHGEFRFFSFNPAAERLTGHTTEQMQGKPPGEKVRQRYVACVEAGVPLTYEECLTFRNKPSWWLTTLNPLRDSTNRIYRIVGTSTNITQRKQALTRLETQSMILERIAKAEPLSGILDTLLRAMEVQLDQSLCSVMLCDRRGILHSLPAPQLPAAYLQAIDGSVAGEGVGSCGTAAFRREAVIVTDIATDPLWQDFKDVALAYGLRACWSMPILASDGRVLGTFGVYFRECRTPQPQEFEHILQAANLAGIAIEREQATRALEQLNQELEQRVEERTLALQVSEERWQLALRGSNDGIWDWDLLNHRVFFSSRWKAMRGFAEDEVGDRLEDWSGGIHPDDRERVMAGLEAHFAGHTEFFEMDYRVRHKDGSYFWVLDRGQVLRDATGQVIRMSGSETDVSDRKRAEAALQKSEQRYRALIENASDGILLADVHGNLIEGNQKAAELLGYSWDELRHLNVMQLHPPEVLEAVHRHFSGIVLHNEGLPFETLCLQKGGTSVPVDITGSRVEIDGEPIVLGIFRDIRGRKQAEMALQNSEIRFRRVFESSVVGMLFADFDGRILDANDRFLKIVGYSRAELESGLVRWNTMTPPEYAALDQVFVEQIQQAGVIEPREKEYFRKDGSRVPVLLGAAILPGTTDQTVCVVLDMSDRKRLEQEQQRLAAILEASTDYIGMSDAATGQVIWNNAAIRQLCGLTRDAALSQRTPADYHPQWAVERLEQQAIPAAIATGSWLGESALLDAAGQEIPVSELLLAHKSPQGQVEFFSAIMRDMRSQKEYERRLERSNAELARATQLKDEFLANMSHELRTPLTAILGMSEVLREEVFGALNPKQHQYTEIIHTSGQHLLTLINDILDVSKIAAGKLELHLSNTPVDVLCTSSLIFVKQLAYKKHIQLDMLLPSALGEIRVDERRMRQVLINLLTNAVKFTPSGGHVMLEVQIQESDPLLQCPVEEVPTGSRFAHHEGQQMLASGSWILFSVSDTGIGIAPEDQTKLFQPFVQIDSSLSRHYEGSGLGLTLVKQIIELHGGYVSLSSHIGQGSCFTVVLPYYPSCEIPLSSPELPLAENDCSGATALSLSNPASELANRCPLILLAEDNEDNIETLSSYLTMHPYRLLIARDGQEAIALTQAHRPDLILMDIQMPGVDGLDAIRTLRRDPELAHIPIIALTALAMEGDRDRCLEAGATDYLSKPAKLKHLVVMIEQLLHSSN